MDRAKLLCLTGGLLLLLSGPVSAADAPADRPADKPPDKPWYQRDFATNHGACLVRPQPAWCRNWLVAMEAGRPKPTDPTLPEWQRLPVEKNFQTCNTLKPPVWCPDWMVAMASVIKQKPYQDMVAAAAAVDTVEAEKQAKIDAERAIWRALLDRVLAGSMSKADIADVERRAAKGEVGALETLAWMNVQGRGMMKNYVRAYELYGQAYLAGRKDLKANLDAIWPHLTGDEKSRMLKKFAR